MNQKSLLIILFVVIWIFQIGGPDTINVKRIFDLIPQIAKRSFGIPKIRGQDKQIFFSHRAHTNSVPETDRLAPYDYLMNRLITAVSFTGS